MESKLKLRFILIVSLCDVIISCLHIHAFEFYGGNRLVTIKFPNIIDILRKKE